MENINQNQVVILGYKEWFAVTPDITILKNGILIGKVAKDGRFQFETNEPCELTFKMGFRSSFCIVKPGDWIQLSFNKTTGEIIAQLTDENNYQQLADSLKQEDDSTKRTLKKVLWVAIIFAIVGFGALYMSGNRHSQDDGTTETIYTTPDGLEIKICDNGVAYVGNSKGKWDNNGYAKIGYNEVTFINVKLDGYSTYCSICEGKLYLGGHSVVVRDYPDGTPLQRKRQ